jgi:AraC-like DNA-binding protein
MLDDCRRPARWYSLPGAPGVDPLDQLRLDPDVNICGFPLHTGEVGSCRARLLDNSSQKIDNRRGNTHPSIRLESPLLWTRGAAARETLNYLERRGIDAEPAMFGAGISRRQLSQDDIGLSVASQYRFLELAAAEANDQLLGLHVAAEMDMRAIGILFYLTGSAPTVSEALENLARYSRTTNEALVVEISQQKDAVILAIRHLQEFGEPHRQFFELLALWLIRTLHKETNRDFTLSRVTFSHARNADLREVHRLLRCPVDFAQGVDSWILPQRVMDLPIVSGDSQLLKILTAHADDLLAERHSVTGLQSMVANQLASLLPRGESRAAIVAQQLGMSQRSLTRHLAEEGTTFAEILEQLRRRLASRYLADDRMSVQQTGWLLGYSEVGAFNHAYKRWTGTAPRRTRKPAPVP